MVRKLSIVKIKPSKLKRKIKVNGSKNSALPIIVASLLNKNTITLTNIANIKDINELISICNDLGANIKRKNNKLIIKPNLINKDVLHESTKTFRASYYLMGLYLALFNHVKIYLPGGCNIGKRPIDFHLKGFIQLGCKYEIKDDIIEIALIQPKPAVITLPKKSLGATVNLVLLASRIDGITTINNISLEPELIDFINFMKKQGVSIQQEKTTLYIKGSNFINKKVKYKVIPDRIEASTFICLGLITNRIKITNFKKEHLNNILTPLINSKANIKVNKYSIIAKKSNIKKLEILSAEYPHLSTDIFPLLIPVMAYSTQECRIKETIYENRFEIAHQLESLGVNIRIQNNECIINSFNDNNNDTATATDLRCAASLLIYALSKDKEITIKNFDIIYRGYSSILKRLNVNYEIVE